jgi:DNA modification methylase
MSVFKNELKEPGESLEFRMEIPEDLHWKELEKYPYFGEIYSNSEGKYYSRAAGRKYRPKIQFESDDEKHLDEGHFQGYSFGVEHFSPEGGWVLDPFVGSGTACIESYLKNRNSIGIEVEYSSHLDQNIKHINTAFKKDAVMKILHGDSREVLPTVNQELDLVITGFPYPIISGSITADAPLYPTKEGFRNRNYTAEKSLGLLKWKGEFLPEMTRTLSMATDKLKVGGHFITLIKDCINKKQPFYLQKYVTESFLNCNPNFEIVGWYLHRHTPETMFMRTHPKKYPGPFPFYQIGVVCKKVYEMDDLM